MLTTPGPLAPDPVVMPSCAVVICAYTEARWDETLRAVRSVQEQVPRHRN